MEADAIFGIESMMSSVIDETYSKFRSLSPLMMTKATSSSFPPTTTKNKKALKSSTFKDLSP